MHEKTAKNMDIWYHFIKDVVPQDKIKVKNINTLKNPIDMMMKPLIATRFTNFLDLVGLRVP